MSEKKGMPRYSADTKEMVVTPSKLQFCKNNTVCSVKIV
ncbi:hypothetical protein DEAC_c41700 [Desulfosporosinus acididurans]|uniref:Uncharacterized protein n=1 Tax=Desulfosporosinus acididurans TaxID=476652 RepID=A0A0J1IH09_9FIRM|nr:hypothetical protein DEAC_c41700 [Desulfosporosinus acididurans]